MYCLDLMSKRTSSPLYKSTEIVYFFIDRFNFKYNCQLSRNIQNKIYEKLINIKFATKSIELISSTIGKMIKTNGRLIFIIIFCFFNCFILTISNSQLVRYHHYFQELKNSSPVNSQTYSNNSKNPAELQSHHHLLSLSLVKSLIILSSCIALILLIITIFYSKFESIFINNNDSSYSFSNENSINLAEQDKQAKQDVEQDKQRESDEQADQNYVSQTKNVSFFGIFRFATYKQIILMILGSISSLAIGLILPLAEYIYGLMLKAFGQDKHQMVKQSKNVMYIYFLIGIAALFFRWISHVLWVIAGLRQVKLCRKAYLASLLSQEIEFFDKINQTQLTSNFVADFLVFQGALTQKNSSVLTTIGLIIGGFGISFSVGWLYSLILFIIVPIITFSCILQIYTVQKKYRSINKYYIKAGGLVQQALASIKTIKILNGQSFQLKKYLDFLQQVVKKAIKFSVLTGIGKGTVYGAWFLLDSFGFWFGSYCIQASNMCKSNQIYTSSDVIGILFCLEYVAFNITQLGPALKKITEGRKAAARIYSIIDRKSLIKNRQNPIIPAQFEGKIKFQNVTFCYPKQKNKIILNNLSLEFNKLTNALVGDSGCGKSTIFQLILRFYDPDFGRITLDGVDLRDLDLTWLRQNIGYVEQEPVLFGCSIKDNLLLGREKATDQEIIIALKNAQAYDFIECLQEKIHTYIGNNGSQLSGGQKQRIAIARALLRNPRILLLDEATSALDRKNELIIQKTLNKLSQKCMTITVAHRIKTIVSCQKIFVLNKGKIQQSGSFQSLQKFKILRKVTDEQGYQGQQNNLKLIKKCQQSIDKKQIKNKLSETLISNEQQSQTYQDLVSEQYAFSLFARLFTYIKVNNGVFITATVMSLFNGIIFILFSMFIAKTLSTLIKFGSITDKFQIRNELNYCCLVLLLLALATFIVNYIKTMLFSYISQISTQNIRIDLYNKILKMPMVWYEKRKNHASKLQQELSQNCKTASNLLTQQLGTAMQSITMMIGSITVGIVYEWRIMLVAVAFLPIYLASGLIEIQNKKNFNRIGTRIQNDSRNIIFESLLNIRTVLSIGYEKGLIQKYSQFIEFLYNQNVIRSNKTGLFFGFTLFIELFRRGLIYFIAAIFIRDIQEVKYQNVLVTLLTIYYSASVIGAHLQIITQVSSSKKAAINIFNILDSQDQDQKQIKQDSKLLTTDIKGYFQIKNISFKYESRNAQVFKNFNLQIQAGNKVAIVGSSGCGKSTLLQIILRFYDIQEGNILLDGKNLKDYDIHHLRSKIGVVSQEPVLFYGSFQQNVVYNLQNVTKDMVINATKQANAYGFITQNQQQDNKECFFKEQNQYLKLNHFSKNVGIRGSHISGGQRQRIAIARCILRNPSILLLDEATSALDSANEKVVQESLDKFMKNKTTISVAHRIDTIKNSDMIYVFDCGKIVQQGTYEQLEKMKRYFYKLQRGIKSN